MEMLAGGPGSWCTSAWVTGDTHLPVQVQKTTTRMGGARAAGSLSLAAREKLV